VDRTDGPYQTLHAPEIPHGSAPDGKPLDVSGHICAFFNSRDEEESVLLPFIKDGLDHGDRAFHVVDPVRRAQHLDDLGNGGIDVADAVRRDQLELRDWSQAHLRDGHFDDERMIALADEASEYARRRGYARTRFVTQMEWALQDGSVNERLAEYEAKANRRVPASGDTVICVYDLARWGAQTLVDVIRTHPRIIIGGVLHENPFFVPPEEFLRELRSRRVRD
jgi:DcmR-like sensory protein